MTIRNRELDNIVFKKQCLVIKFDRRLINEETYNEKMSELNRKAEELRNKLMNDFSERKKQIEAEKKMEETNKVEEKKVGRKPREGSYSMTIIQTLMKKSVKNIDEVVEQVDEVKPGRDKSKIKQQAKMIIYLVKKQKAKRWEQYSWDEENFLLTQKE